MDVIGTLIFWGFIWVALTWRCFAVTSICKEVAEGKTTKDTLFFQLLQVGIFIFTSITILRSGTKDIPAIVTAISLIFTSFWYLYSCAKAGLELRKKQAKTGQERVLAPSPHTTQHAAPHLAVRKEDKETMDPKPKNRYRIPKWTVIAFLTVATIMGWRFFFSSPSFDANEVARAETRMWQAYYSGDRTELGLQLISLLRNQYGLSLLEAKEIGELLASSALTFRTSTGNSENGALGKLTEAYRLIKRASGRSFDPEKAARAELAWWIARRTPGQDSAEQVGQKIAELYTILCGDGHPSLPAAGLLRSEAAELRDSGGQNADWARIEDLLRQSYSELEKAL